MKPRLSFLLLGSAFLPSLLQARDLPTLDAAAAAASVRGLESLQEQAKAKREPIETIQLGSWFEPRRHTAEDLPIDDLGVRLRGTPATDWTPYAGTFAHEEASHLLRRTVIGARWSEIETASNNGLDATVDLLFAPRFPPAPPGAWATQPVPDVTGWSQQMIDSLIVLYQERTEILRMWWPDVMVHQETSVRESMVHFWHDHFATGTEKVFYPQSMFVQNDLFRDHAFGNFKDLTREVAYDPAMLLWLDGQVNRVGNLNENFARELLELFTLGVDQYTQDDVVNVARAFTGYVTADGVTSFFVPAWHDNGTKIIFGQSGNFDGDDVIEILFQQDETARFLSRKLYRWFLDEMPDEALIEELAQTMRANDYEVRPVLEQMFRSERFFDVEFRGSLFKDGVDHYAGLVRSFDLGPTFDLSDPMSNQAVFVRYSMFVYDHILFEPPNVAGWPGYRSWLNSYTMPWRKTLDVGLIDGQTLGYPILLQADLLDLAGQFREPNDPYLLIEDTATLLFGFQPTELVQQRLLDELLQGSEPWEWNLFEPNAETQLQSMFRLALRLPDVQVK